MVERWNIAVGAKDTVWHLGDFAVGVPVARAAALLALLHGTKHLVAGNGDGAAVRALPGWASVQDYRELALDGRRLVLCHYPLRAWNGQQRGALDLQGQPLFDEVIVTNSHPNAVRLAGDYLKVKSISYILVEAVLRLLRPGA